MKYRLLWGAAAAGVFVHLLGLSWDVYLHSRDSSLAAREGLLTLSNPSHALIVLGVALTSASVLASASRGWKSTEAAGVAGAAAPFGSPRSPWL